MFVVYLLCVYEFGQTHNVHVEVRGQRTGGGSLLPSCGSQGPTQVVSGSSCFDLSPHCPDRLFRSGEPSSADSASSGHSGFSHVNTHNCEVTSQGCLGPGEMQGLCPQQRQQHREATSICTDCGRARLKPGLGSGFGRVSCDFQRLSTLPPWLDFQ